MNNIPVFVKGGSFIPMSIESKSTASYNLDEFEMHYYADPLAVKSDYSLYNDDGITPYANEKDKYELLNFTAVNEESSLTISMQKVTKDVTYADKSHKIKFFVHNLAMKPASIVVNGQPINPKKISWNPVTNKLIFDVVCTTTNSDIIINK